MSAALASSHLRPVTLRTEYATNPLGLDTPRPRLSWISELTDATVRGERQTAYQVQVASSPEALAKGQADLWDSGRVEGAASLHVEYAGKALRTGQRAHWRVRVWDAAGEASAWSEPAWWEMALLAKEDWGARWITRGNPEPTSDAEQFAERPNPLFRREFRVSKPVARARAYVCGLGYCELRLNGQRVGDQVLDPAWTTYSRRVLYSTYDVTKLLQPGANALGAELGNGWYNLQPLRMFRRFNFRAALPTGQPRLILRLQIEYTDGTHETVVTDENWKAGDGPLLRNGVYVGELYDARREQSGWDRPGFNEQGWKPAVPAAGEIGPLHAQTVPPIRVGETLKPVARTEPSPGTYVFDLGRNFSGWATLRVKGAAGTRVTLRYGELSHKDGSLNPMTSVTGQIKGATENEAIGAPVTAYQTDTYVLKGEGEESYTPRFTFRGFRYLEVTGYPGVPALEAVTGHAVHTDLASAGEFTCSNELLNQIQVASRRTLLNNVHSVQSDCPHREKLGYGGDIVATSDYVMLNFDVERFYAKTVEDFADAARPNGGFPETAPFVGIDDEGLGEGAGPVGWGTAHPLLVWQLYQYYGDRRLLAEQYGAAQRWLALLEARAPEGILDNGISDHESLVEKPRPVTGTGFLYQNARLLERMAQILGHTEDAKKYEALAGKTATAFNKRFLEPASGKYFTGTQASQAVALYFGLVPPQHREAALKTLVDNLKTQRITTGIFGTKYMLMALADLGRADAAYETVNSREFPGWGYMLEHGATTLWEHWAFSDNTFSHNHPMFGSVSEWFYRALAGINPSEDAEGFNRLTLRPLPVGDLKWVRAHHDTVRGRVASEWRHENGTFTWQVQVPVGAVATVTVPGKSATEGGKPAQNAKGVILVREEASGTVLRVEAGSYTFASELK